jgi:hypothetical protein
VKKFISLFLIFFICGCSNETLKCSKTNYSTIYGKEIDNEIYIFNKKKLINYSTTKKIIFDSDMLKYMDDLYSYFEKEKKIVIDSIKGSNYVLIRNEKDILCNISVTMSDTNDSLSKLNVDKNVSIDYLNNNLTEKGFYCVLE